MGNGQGAIVKQWEVGSGKWEVGSGKWEVGSGEVGSEMWDQFVSNLTKFGSNFDTMLTPY